VAHREMASTQKGAEHNGQSLWFIDESGFYPLPAVVRSYSPRGYPPVLREWSTRDHLSAICAISPEGAVHLAMQEEAFNSKTVVGFLQHLLRVVPGKLLILWDGSPIHRGDAIRDFLANGAAKRIHLERLPSYAPDLDPAEGLWAHLKGVELRNLCCFDLPHLRADLRKAVKRVRQKPHIVVGCFHDLNL
jgi:transposase